MICMPLRDKQIDKATNENLNATYKSPNLSRQKRQFGPKWQITERVNIPVR